MYCAKRRINDALRPTSMSHEKFTLTQWHATHDVISRTCLKQQQYSDTILRESDLLTDTILEKTKLLRTDSDHLLKTRVDELDFYAGELQKFRKELLSEMEYLVTDMNRLEDFRSSIEDFAGICKKCLLIREGRIGIDLVHDEVQEALLQELHVIQGVQDMLKRLDGQMREQLRILRAALYSLDRNLEDKVHALRIDERNKALITTSITLYTYTGKSPLNPSNISPEEWVDHTTNIISSTLDKLSSSRQIRVFAETLRKQSVDDLVVQRTIVDDAIHQKVSEVKELKSSLEERHSDISKKCQEMMENIRKIQRAIKNEEPYLALSHTRLGNRAHRRNVELVRDLSETQLAYEVSQLRSSVDRLLRLHLESQESLRQLLRTQLSLQEQINVKAVSIEVDEVECLTIRQRMDYFS